MSDHVNVNVDFENRFTHHPPQKNDIHKFEKIRILAKDFAWMLDALVPDGREKSLAVTKLEEVVMWANAGIARSNTDQDE